MSNVSSLVLCPRHDVFHHYAYPSGGLGVFGAKQEQTEGVRIRADIGPLWRPEVERETRELRISCMSGRKTQDHWFELLREPHSFIVLLQLVLARSLGLVEDRASHALQTIGR